MSLIKSDTQHAGLELDLQVANDGLTKYKQYVNRSIDLAAVLDAWDGQLTFLIMDLSTWDMWNPHA